MKHVIPIGGQTTPVPQSECPACLTVMDRATGKKGEVPSPNDFTICGFCGAILRFTEDLQLRPVDDTEIEALDEDVREELLRLSRSLKEVYKQVMLTNKPVAAYIGVHRKPNP